MIKYNKIKMKIVGIQFVKPSKIEKKGVLLKPEIGKFLCENHYYCNKDIESQNKKKTPQNYNTNSYERQFPE